MDDVTRTTKEACWRIRFSGIETRVKWEFDLKWVTAGAAGGSVVLGGPLGAIIGGAAGLTPKIEFSSAAALERAPSRATPYEYVALTQKEIGRRSQRCSAFFSERDIGVPLANGWKVREL